MVIYLSYGAAYPTHQSGIECQCYVNITLNNILEIYG